MHNQNSEAQEIRSAILRKAHEMHELIESLARIPAAKGDVDAVYWIMAEASKPHRIAHKLEQVCDNLQI